MSQGSAQLLVHGLVQGVGYRYFCYREALARNLTGWVRNQPTGSVELLVEGDSGMIRDLIKTLRVGPFNAHVTSVEENWKPYSGEFSDFQIRMS